MATAFAIDQDDGFGAAADRLCAGIAALERDQRRLTLAALCRRVDAIRAAARGDGMVAVAGIAAGLSDALARDGRAALVGPYLAAMRESCGCRPGDAAAADTLLASIGVRLAG